MSSETLSVRPRPCLKMFITLPHSRPLRTCGVSRVIFALHLSRTNLFERSDPRFRSGQTRERIPSNAWARKIAAPTKPITAVIVSNIANVPLRPCATENGDHLAQSKDFRAPTHNPDRRGFCATDVHRLVIQHREFGISHDAGHLTFMTVMCVMKRGYIG